MNTHAAILHDDCGAIALRRFATARGAAHIAAQRELRNPPDVATVIMSVRRGAHAQLRHTEFARELGISQRIVRDAYKRGELPGAMEHSAYILMVPTAILRLAKIYGLRHVGRLAKAGRLPGLALRENENENEND
jgi:hypothetical protein